MEDQRVNIFFEVNILYYNKWSYVQLLKINLQRPKMWFNGLHTEADLPLIWSSFHHELKDPDHVSRTVMSCDSGTYRSINGGFSLPTMRIFAS